MGHGRRNLPLGYMAMGAEGRMNSSVRNDASSHNCFLQPSGLLSLSVELNVSAYFPLPPMCPHVSSCPRVHQSLWSIYLPYSWCRPCKYPCSRAAVLNNSSHRPRHASWRVAQLNDESHKQLSMDLGWVGMCGIAVPRVSDSLNHPL
jgi:hypothetical protein